MLASHSSLVVPVISQSSRLFCPDFLFVIGIHLLAHLSLVDKLATVFLSLFLSLQLRNGSVMVFHKVGTEYVESFSISTQKNGF